jgi:hypothetical protein
MNGRGALAGLLFLSALALCLFAAPAAFATETGTTAVTCVNGGATNDFGDAHCDTPEASGGYGHVKIVGKTSEVEGTNASTAGETKEATNAVLKTTIAGLETEIVCKKVSSTGALENSLVGEEHRISGSGIAISYTECSVLKPAGQECKVHSGSEPIGTIKTESLKSESIEEPMGQKFSPSAGELFVSITLSGCKSAGLNMSYEIKGTVAAAPSGTGNPSSAGATLLVNLPKNSSSTLTVGGQKAGLTQVETIKMEGGNPIGTTGTPFTGNEETGTTAVTCVKGAASNDFGDAHCDTTKTGGGFGHVRIEGKTTEVEGTNASTAGETKEATNAVLKATLSGIETEIVCTTVGSTGTVENKSEGEAHRIIGSETFVNYTGCTVPKPAGQECAVVEDIEATKTEGTEGQIKTTSLKSESIEVEAEHSSSSRQPRAAGSPASSSEAAKRQA